MSGVGDWWHWFRRHFILLNGWQNTLNKRWGIESDDNKIDRYKHCNSVTYFTALVHWNSGFIILYNLILWCIILDSKYLRPNKKHRHCSIVNCYPFKVFLFAFESRIRCVLLRMCTIVAYVYCWVSVDWVFATLLSCFHHTVDTW